MDNEDDDELQQEVDLIMGEKQESDNVDLEIINNSFYLIKELIALESNLYDQFAEDKIKIVTQTFQVISVVNKKIISDYKKK